MRVLQRHRDPIPKDREAPQVLVAEGPAHRVDAGEDAENLVAQKQGCGRHLSGRGSQPQLRVAFLLLRQLVRELG